MTPTRLHRELLSGRYTTVSMMFEEDEDDMLETTSSCRRSSSRDGSCMNFVVAADKRPSTEKQASGVPMLDAYPSN